MAEQRKPSARYEEIALRLIAEEECLFHIAASEARIAFLASDAKKKHHGKAVFGQCERVPSKWQWSVPYDFAITIYEPNVMGFDDGRIRILLLHELLHIGIDRGEEGESYHIVPHDVEDFGEVMNRFGNEWYLAPVHAPMLAMAT